MEEPMVALADSWAGNIKPTQQEDKGSKEGTDGCNTPKEKLVFDLPEERNGTPQRKWADTNLFKALNGEGNASDFLRKALEALNGSWIFQGKKKHKVKIE